MRKSDKGWGIGRHVYDVVPGNGVIDGEKIAIAASHQDQVIEPPAGATPIFHSTFTPHAGLLYANGSAMSVQPHPEFTPAFADWCCEKAGRNGAPAALVASARASLEQPLDHRRPRPRDRALSGKAAQGVNALRPKRRDKLTRRANHFRFTEIMSSPEIKNISLYQKCKSGYIACHPVPTRGAYHDRHERGTGSGGRGSADNERRESVRQRRVVLTPRCWRQCTWRQQLSGRDGGKRAVLRGERVISRKAIAQGMSDVLRCPVCSCAHFLCTLRMRPRVQRASGIPCAL